MDEMHKPANMPSFSATNRARPQRLSAGRPRGLALLVYPTGERRWVLRLAVRGKHRNIPIGSYPALGMEDAQARAWQAIRNAREPASTPWVQRQANGDTSVVTFGEVAGRYIAMQALRSRRRERPEWRRILENKVYPVLGNVAIRDIDPSDIRAILEPLGRTNARTAALVRRRIGAILDWAFACGYGGAERSNDAEV